MNVLAHSLYKKKIVASYLPQSTALGAFLYLHELQGIKGDNFNLHFKVYNSLKSQKNAPKLD
jgi:hypothetical protein